VKGAIAVVINHKKGPNQYNSTIQYWEVLVGKLLNTRREEKLLYNNEGEDE